MRRSSSGLLIFFALIAALGCRVSEGVSDAGFVPDAGHNPNPPIDSGLINPQLDSGVQDSGSADSAVEPPLPPNFTLECASEPESGTFDDVIDWEAQRDAHGALGRAATFSLEGNAYRVHGTAVANVTAPFSLRTGEISSGLINFANAEVEGVDERGELTLFGVERELMTASAGSIEDIALKTVVLEKGVLTGDIDVVTERRGNSDFYHAEATVSDLVLDDVDRAFLMPEGTTTVEERIEWMPTGSVVITEASQLTFHEENVSALEMAPSERAFEYEAFSLAGDFTSGTLEIENKAVQGTPAAIFGREAVVTSDASSLEARETFRLTQAINEAGLVVPASVEIVAETPEVWVPVNETRIVRFHYRERSYVGDAVLGEIQIGGQAEDLLELQTGFPETRTGEIIEAVIDTGWGAPLAAIAALPVVSIVFVIDVFECIFGGCLDLPGPLDPFPQWIEAGEIGTMEVRVKGDLVSGTYQTSITFVGRNYCPVTVPLTVHVGVEPPPEDAGTDAATADGSVDGG
jgi:hypothetical protein